MSTHRLNPATYSKNVILPAELVQILNEGYFLHLLATDPTKVLPPGKSLLSVMTRPEIVLGTPKSQTAALHDKVEDLVHRAFWDEVRSADYYSVLSHTYRK